MNYTVLRKALIVMVLMVPLFLDTGCKKQVRCGCGNDVVRTLQKEPARVHFDVENNSARFNLAGITSDTFYLCNPSAFMEYLSQFTSPVMLLVSGEAFWECNYLYNSANHPYMPYRVYQIEVTEMEEDLYGK